VPATIGTYKMNEGVGYILSFLAKTLCITKLRREFGLIANLVSAHITSAIQIHNSKKNGVENMNGIIKVQLLIVT
jgi:hypothetical protein